MHEKHLSPGKMIPKYSSYWKCFIDSSQPSCCPHLGTRKEVKQLSSTSQINCVSKLGHIVYTDKFCFLLILKPSDQIVFGNGLDSKVSSVKQCSEV